MNISVVHYEGSLRTKAVHNRSGQIIHTDAPKDNKGKGEAFSPTDLLTTSLANCMLTIMGIKAREHDIGLEEVTVKVGKVMDANPRRVKEIQLEFDVKSPGLTQNEQEVLEKAARNCPVALSLADSTYQKVTFNYR